MYVLATILTFVLMECVTWFTHKFVMHGFLWNLHEDHHNPRKQFFEKNDLFFVIFAIPSIALFAIGGFTEVKICTYIALGILLYGLAYFLVHDVFIHRRFTWLRNSNSLYFRALRKAHKVHHKHLSKEQGECFGMLFVPLKYFREAKKK